MRLSISILLLFAFAFISCNEPKENTQPETPVKMEGELSAFTCSDSSLNNRFKKLSQNFEERMDLKEDSWLVALPYFRMAAPYMENADAAEAVHLMWNTYMQTGNKLAISEHPIWEKDLESLFPESDSLYTALQNHERFQRLAYLALALKKEDVAQTALQSSVGIFQKNVKDNFNSEEHSFGLSLNEDLLALSMDLLPKEEANSIIRNVQSKLLQEGLDPSFLASSQHVLLPLLSKYDQLDLAYRLVDKLPDELVGAWMITELAGIRPSLNAPGFRNPIIHPKILSELDFVEGQLKTPYGLLYIRVDYVKPLKIQVKIPARATLVLPVKDPTRASILANKTRLWMGGKPQPAPAGVKVIDVIKDGVIVELAKGKYTFQIKS